MSRKRSGHSSLPQTSVDPVRVTPRFVIVGMLTQSLRGMSLPCVCMRSKGLCDRSWCLSTLFTPCRACTARGKVIALGLGIYVCKFHNFLNLSKYSPSEVQSNTGRLLFKFNRFQYTLAAPEVFVAFANPVSLPSRYRVGIVRNTNINKIETTLLWYCS